MNEHYVDGKGPGNICTLTLMVDGSFRTKDKWPWNCEEVLRRMILFYLQVWRDKSGLDVMSLFMKINSPIRRASIIGFYVPWRSSRLQTSKI